jgi:hypothetical protein
MHFHNTGNGLILTISNREKVAIQKIIDLIIKELNGELSTRTGYSEQEYKDLQMKFIDSSLHEQVFNEQEIIMIHQMFNEVCNGINIINYEDSIGLAKNEAKSLLVYFNKIIES